MKTFLFTARYLPFPQPISRPIEPGDSSARKRSIKGHGWGRLGQFCLELEDVGGTHTLYRVEEK